MHNSPEHEVRSGTVKAAIWTNEGGGRPRYGVTLSRLYKAGEEWRDSKSFGAADLSRVIEVAALAMRWIAMQPDGGPAGLSAATGPADALEGGDEGEVFPAA
jgi:hypothetical protein